MECALENITVHYEVFGEGKLIFILPGWGLNTRWAAYEIEPCFEGREGWRRVYIDPPGHGKTPGKDWITDLDKVLEVVLTCIDKLSAGERFSLIGTSLGAYLARGVRRDRPQQIDGLAMIVPVIVAPDHQRKVPPYRVVVEDPSVKAEITPAEKDLYEMAVVHTRSWLDYQRSYPEVPEQEMGDFEFLGRIRAQADKYAFSSDVDAGSEAFPGPSLIISGRQDAIVGYQDAWNLLEKYPRATYAVLDRAGHQMEDQQAVVRALMGDWLSRLEESIKYNQG